MSCRKQRAIFKLSLRTVQQVYILRINENISARHVLIKRFTIQTR